MLNSKLVNTLSESSSKAQLEKHRMNVEYYVKQSQWQYHDHTDMDGGCRKRDYLEDG